MQHSHYWRDYWCNYSSLLGTKEPAKEALRAITGIRVRYHYSALDENSDLNSHEFYLAAQHAGRTWAVVVDQSISYYGKSSFSVTAEPYDPKTYVDYAKALQAATKSCPVPQ
jgi:hypothetical protein